MELQVKNFDQQITQQLKLILDYSAAFAKQLEFYNQADKAKTDRIFIQLSFAIQNIRQIATPALSSGQIHGLPKEMTEAADEPVILVVDKEHPNWDFFPWFYEKFHTIEKAHERLLEYYEMDLSALQLAPNSGMTPIEDVVDKMKNKLGTMKPYAEVILQMFESGRLTIRDVRLEEEY